MEIADTRKIQIDYTTIHTAKGSKVPLNGTHDE